MGEAVHISSRRRRILAELCSDKTGDEIAEALGCSRSNIYNELSRIKIALGVSTLPGLAARALVLGVVSAPHSPDWVSKPIVRTPSPG